MIGNDLADLQLAPRRVPVEVDTPGTGEVDDYPLDSRVTVWVPYLSPESKRRAGAA